MKKKFVSRVLLLILMLIVIVPLALCSNNSDNSKESAQLVTKAQIAKEISICGSSQYYNYQELKDEADIVALVQCEDEISFDNSTLYYDKGLVVGFSSKRNVRILDVYKGKDNIETLDILEPAAVTEDNELIYLEDYETLKKGSRYIVFLSNDTYSGEYSLISGNNGKIDIDNISDNEFLDIAVKSLVEYKSKLRNDEKEEIVSSNIKIKNILNNSKEISLTDMDSKIKYSEKNNVIYVDIDE